jgi:quercetin dioxygenase-like cupin family protein
MLLAALATQEGDQQLSSHCWTFEGLEATKNPKNGNESRNVFDGRSHVGGRVDLHITTLSPGQMPHPAHRHVHDEMILIEEGTLDVEISGRTQRIGPGGVAYVCSNDLHGWKNVGDGPARYFVLAFGKEGKA